MKFHHHDKGPCTHLKMKKKIGENFVMEIAYYCLALESKTFPHL